MQKIQPGNFTVTAKVTLGKSGENYGIAADIEVSLPDLPRDKAQALIEAAHQVCPYSRATRGNIEVNVKLADH
jgi:organic hydroperoxide reductase OsmC/OhrA